MSEKVDGPNFISSLEFYAIVGGTMILAKFPVPGRPTIWMKVGQGLIALVEGAGGGWFGLFNSPLSFFCSFSLSLGDGPI